MTYSIQSGRDEQKTNKKLSDDEIKSEFGPIQSLSEHLIVSYSTHSLYILSRTDRDFAVRMDLPKSKDFFFRCL